MPKCVYFFIAFTLAATTLMAQPNGFNYVLDPTFGDGLSSGDPTATGQWNLLPWWENVQPLGNNTDWYGPNFMPGGNSSHPFYVVLDDDNQDYGALAGNISDLQYRLVQCNFDYRIFHPTDSASTTKGGRLWVLLTTSENEVRSFDDADPARFEADGHGQVLFDFFIQGGFHPELSDPWNSLAAINPSNPSYRRKYALSHSPVGAQNDPFTYVGLVWKSADELSSICIDNFSLVDVCPDCFMTPPVTDTGCFDNHWITPIPNNYYYYTVAIVDSATNATVFNATHMPAPFEWDGLGNVGVWNGVQVSAGQQLEATMTYYSCLIATDNVRTRIYKFSRRIGCIDPSFGGSKALPVLPASLQVTPNPAESNSPLSCRWIADQDDVASFSVWDCTGRVLYVGTDLAINRGEGGLQLPVTFPPGLYICWLNGSHIHTSAVFVIQ